MLLSKLLKLSFFAVVVGVSLSANATVMFTGNFETGNLTQWTKYQAENASRVEVLTSPVAQGHYAMRVEVLHGDIASSGNRAEVVHGTAEVEGNERYFSWETMFDASYPIENAWQLFTQWHHSGPDGSPPIEFGVYGSSLKITSHGSIILWTAPLVKAKWHKFVAHIMFSSNASVGFLEIYYDGVKVMKKNFATLYPGQTDYLKQGLYRNAIIPSPGIVYHDGMMEGTHLAEVAPELIAASTATFTADAQDAAAAAAEPVTSASAASDKEAVQMNAAELAQMESERQDSPLSDLAGVDTIEADSQASLASGTGCTSAGASTPAFALAALAVLALVRRARRIAVKVRG